MSDSVKEEVVFKEEEAPAKKKNPFIAFCSEHRSAVKESNPEMKMTDISKELGKKWKELSEEEKAAYR